MNRTIRRIVSKRIIVFIAIITLYQRVSAEGMSNVIFKKKCFIFEEYNYILCFPRKTTARKQSV